MNVVLTGAAGFIGFHTGLALLKKKNFVYGIDDVNPYYDVSLKRDRLSILRKYKNFYFIKKKIEGITDNFKNLINPEIIYQSK